MVPARGPRPRPETHPAYPVPAAAQPGLTAPAWRADLALAFNTLVWGSTFVLIKRALDDCSALLFVAIRFSIAAVVLAWLFRRRLTPRAAQSRGGVVAGICLFAGFAFQTAGLR